MWNQTLGHDIQTGQLPVPCIKLPVLSRGQPWAPHPGFCWAQPRHPELAGIQGPGRNPEASLIALCTWPQYCSSPRPFLKSGTESSSCLQVALSPLYHPRSLAAKSNIQWGSSTISYQVNLNHRQDCDWHRENVGKPNVTCQIGKKCQLLYWSNKPIWDWGVSSTSLYPNSLSVTD